MKEVEKYMEHMDSSRFDWRTAQMFLEAGMGCQLQIFEMLEGDGGGWEISISLRELRVYSPFRVDLWILAAPGASENKKWPTLEAARKAIRDALPAGAGEGVTVHFVRC